MNSDTLTHFTHTHTLVQSLGVAFTNLSIYSKYFNKLLRVSGDVTPVIWSRSRSRREELSRIHYNAALTSIKTD